MELNVPVYLDIFSDDYCEFLEILPVGNDIYKLTPLWEDEVEGIYTAEAVEGKGNYIQFNIKLNKEVIEKVLKFNDFENFENIPEIITVDGLYEYSLESCHFAIDKYRNIVSLESFISIECDFT